MAGASIWAAAALLVGYVVWTVIYSYTLHPLAQYPGPWWAHITRIPYWIAAMKGEQHKLMKGLHDKYGPVIRFSPHELSYTDSQAWKEICGHEKGRTENYKAVEAHLPPMNKTYNLVQAPYEQHRRMRRLFAPAFSDRSLKEQEPMFQKYANLLVKKLRESNGQTAPLGEMLNFTTFDIMGELSFGQSLGLLESNKYSSWVANVFDAVRVLPFVQFIEYYPYLSQIFNFLEPKSLTEMKTSHWKHSADRVDRRLETKSDKPDIWNLVLSAESDQSLSIEEMHSSADLFMLAGSETTATLMCGLTYLLTQDPERMAKLVKEVREANKAHGLAFDSVANLPYLNACIDEALRLYPPVPVGIPRIVPKDNGGRVICGKWVPSDTRISVHQYATYHSPDNFKNPDSFIPERWLGDPEYADDKREAVQPFSYGPRNCIGQNMAQHEMRLLFASVLANFDLKLCDESRNWMDQKVYVLWDKKPLMVKLLPIAEEVKVNGL